MRELQRRQLLEAGGASFLAALWPAWLASAVGPRAAREVLAPALARAKELGKPLVVFVAPAGETSGWFEYGDLIGQVLRRGGNALFLDLALAEVACVRALELEQRFPDVIGEPTFCVITQATGRESIEPVEVALAPRPEFADDEAPERMRDEFARWVRPLVDALRRAVVADGAKLPHLERRARLSLDFETLAAAERAIRGRELPTLAVIDHAAALFRVAAERSDEARALWLPKLVRAARARLWVRAPRGASWGSSSCGTPIDAEDFGPEDDGASELPQEFDPGATAYIGCGMGAISNTSSRFLYFWSERG